MSEHVCMATKLYVVKYACSNTSSYLASETSPLSVHVNRDSWVGGQAIGRNFEISLRRGGIVNGMSAQK